MSAMDCICPPAPKRPARRPVLLLIGRFMALRRQRAQLARLGPEALRDIGITSDQARIEARRPAWDAPRHWRK